MEPEVGCRCDISSCQVHAEPWELFEGCGHSFHNICLQETGSCPLCKQFLSQKVQELGSVARDAILHPEDKDITDINPNPEIPNIDDDDDSCNNTPECSTFKSANPSNLKELKETINKLNSAISSLGQARQPLLHHRPSNTSKPRQAKKKEQYCYFNNQKCMHCNITTAMSNCSCYRMSKKCQKNYV